jgi:Zn-dependent protease
MQTIHGIRFLPVMRIDGMQLGLDARWLGLRGLSLMVLLTLANMASQLGQDLGSPLWVRLCTASLIVPAIVLTSMGHELGHVIASRLAGLSVRAVVLAPQGGMTIRTSSEEPAVNFLTALAGPTANAAQGMVCIWLALVLELDGPLLTFVVELAALQLLTAAANIVPFGPMDGRRMLEAWRSATAIRRLVSVTADSHQIAIR